MIPEIPIGTKVWLGGLVALGGFIVAREIFRRLMKFTLDRTGDWFVRVAALPDELAKISLSSKRNARRLKALRLAQAEMREYVCERIDEASAVVRNEVLGRCDLLEATLTGEDRVLAGRILAMETTVGGMEGRLNTTAATAPLPTHPHAHPSVRPIARRPGNGSGRKPDES